MISGINE